MNYEEKYEQALEKARELMNKGYDVLMPEIFPELQESEDERIRKGLIKSISSLLDNTILYDTNITKEEALAWLEKQEEPKNKGEISDGYHTFNELYRYRMLYNAAFFNLLPKHMVHKSKRHHDGEECFGGGWFIVMANLPTGQISNHYELKDWDLFKIPEKEVADEWDGHTPQDAADRLHKYLLEKQGENTHTDEVESKFHEGEWIIHQGTENIYQVVACIDNQYQLKYGDNYTVQKCTDVDRCARLWTIADAKDGDVLVVNNEVFIYAHRKQMYSIAVAHCFVDSAGGFYLDGEFGYEENGKTISPATKKQFDLLFQRMKEAGYEWDSEKKELKKIEVTSKESEDERIREQLCDFLRDNMLHQDAQYFISWLEKQNKQKFSNIPSRETILAVWELGNDWKDLTKGVCSTEHGTQLKYIQNHWQESSYYDNIMEDGGRKQPL